MSDIPAPPVPAGLDPPGPESLSTDEIEVILTDFRAWLNEARASPDCADGLDEDRESAEFDIATFVQHFIALRQEVNLQTRATRAQQEQNAQAMEILQEALSSAQRQQNLQRQAEQGLQDEQLRPVLKALIDAHDALALAEREVRRLLGVPAGASLVSLPPPPPKVWIPYWARWLGLGDLIEKQLAPLHAWHAAQVEACAIDEAAARQRRVLDALLVGYGMSLQRLDRALEQQGLEPIACVGQPFDPERMEVAEVIRDEGRTGTEVIEEVRRGYLWRGRLFRFTQVRVARP